MTEEKQQRSPKRIWAPVLVLVVLAAFIGFYYFAILLPAQQNPGPVPENGIDIALGKGGDTSPDGTKCHNLINLEEANRDKFGNPTVVDINEKNGNLFVRGPEPLVVRDGTDTSAGCKNLADWHFAYDELSAMLKKEKDVTPAYFTSAKQSALTAQMQNFNIADYHVIDISLLSADPNDSSQRAFFNGESLSFGQKYSSCSAQPVDTTLRGQPGNLIWSPISGCTDQGSCQVVLNQDAGGLCSYTNLMNQISSLMAQNGDKKYLIYVHCHHGADRTGEVVMGYLMKDSGLSFADAKTYTENLGQKTPPSYPTPVTSTYYTMATYYCNQIKGTSCPALSGAASGSPTAVITPVTTATPLTTLPMQTPVPSQTRVTRYNPQSSGGDTI